jgi:2-polyprenyl-6-methoxyphenol hydroxylase-like FAD-dependent oxidoreductase
LRLPAVYRSLIYEAIKDAQPASPIATLRFPVNHRRHYERLSRFPEGLVVLGDAVCSFNPIYAQGMTVAALEADLLSSCLSEHQRTYPPGELTGFSRRFQKKIAPIVNTFWLITASEDFRLPETRGRRPPFVGLLNSYSRRIQELSACDPQVMRLFFEVQHALKGPLALFSPTIVAKVLFTSPSRRRDQEGTDTSPDA